MNIQNQRPGIFFDRLIRSIDENTSYKLNSNGIEIIKKYHNIIHEIEKSIFPILQHITKDPAVQSKQIAIQIISSLNSNQAGNEEFELMTRLDTLTNGGKTPISGASFTFNPQDKILQYLEKSN